MKGRITQRKTEVATSTLPEIGKIKIGEKYKSAGGKEVPRSLDYFRATGTYAPAFLAQYGERPNLLTIAFVSDNIEEVCNERYEAWVGSKRHGWGDGQEFTVWSDQEKAYIHAEKDHFLVKKLKWDTILTLRFVLLELRGVMGYWTFSTKGSLTTIPSVVNSFDFVRERANTVVGFPFNLVVEKQTGHSPEGNKSYSTVRLVPNASQDSMDMVREYLEAGGSVSELTTQKIEQKLLK